MQVYSRRMLFLCLCLLASVAILSTGCHSIPPGPTKSCYTDRDCPTGYTCSFLGNKTQNKRVASEDVAAPLPCKAGQSKCGRRSHPPISRRGQCIRQNKPKPNGCLKDSDCKTGQYCKLPSDGPSNCKIEADGIRRCSLRRVPDGVCVDKPKTKRCTSNRDCSTGQYCKFTSNPNPPQCGTASDPSGFRAPCAKRVAGLPVPVGICVNKPTPSGCRNDRDCKRNEYCLRYAKPLPAKSGGELRVKPNEPPMTGVCKPRPTPRHCIRDRDCKSGEYCSIYEHTTNSSSDRQGMPAPRGICKPRPTRKCTNSNDCKRDEYCAFGGISKGGGSTGDSSGAPEERKMPAPRTGICKPRPYGCIKDSDCKSNEYCAFGSSSGGGVTEPAPAPFVARKGFCKPRPTARKCLSDVDCKANEHCVPATRTSGGATEPVRKRPAPYPNYGICKPRPQTKCSTNADCKRDEICVLNKPTPAPAPPTGKRMPAPRQGICVPRPKTKCMTDKDCASDQYCAGVKLEKPGSTGDMPAPSMGICKPRSYGCIKDSDCKQGEYCAFQSGTDKPAPAPAPFVARKGFCKPRPTARKCLSDADCKANEHCVPATRTNGGAIEPVRKRPAPYPNYGICKPRPKTKCSTSSDCKRDEICILNKTTPAPAPPTGKRMPAPYQGICVPRPKTKCKSDKDCAKGQICQKKTSMPAPCNPKVSGCGGLRPPPVTYGVCVENVTCKVTKRSSDGRTVCEVCSDGTSRCTSHQP